MKIRSVLLGAILVLVLTLVACTEDFTTVAISYLDALNNQDLDRAAALACEEQADEIMDGLMTVTPEEQATVEFQQVSCSQQAGNEVSCHFTIVQEETEFNNDTVFKQERNVVFDIEDGRICGFREEVAN